MYYSKSTGGFYSLDIHGEGMPSDAVEISDDTHASLLQGQASGYRISAGADGYPVLDAPPPPTADQLNGILTDAVQAHLDATASSVGYDSIYTACTYADEPSVAKFQAEGRALRAWRSRVWARCYEVLTAVEAGQRGIPAAEELIAELPALVMP